VFVLGNGQVREEFLGLERALHKDPGMVVLPLPRITAKVPRTHVFCRAIPLHSDISKQISHLTIQKKLLNLAFELAA
jgi:hypothetical protein